MAIGSAGANATAVIDGEVDANVHSGGQREWDSAAPAGVLTATGVALAPILLGAIRDAYR